MVVLNMPPVNRVLYITCQILYYMIIIKSYLKIKKNYRTDYNLNRKCLKN